MANPNKQKGTAWESSVRDYLNVELGQVDEYGRLLDPFDGMNVRRPAQEGARDVGDVHAVPFVLEAKDVAKPTVPSFLRQAEVEAQHAGFPYGVAVVKVRRANVRAGKVHFTVRTWTRVRLALGLKSRDFADRYGFGFSLRGLDTGRWYATTDLERFARLLGDVRAARRHTR
ncbi:hypothetical protein GCM10010193_08940 [Kitasatospora atroaurantiaca]|uniref:Uncharacterized protein n=1 Tax=Kitasatospora atroaurantiaca TaxID=285545 RepID=A0A561ERW3_9ACTN|nr:hypothetical protein [Kitasatospora atroaurantiaca]TWE18347.1 hypothetical protein FB465_3414 [Kitasatospora atroaurantiaca]